MVHTLDPEERDREYPGSLTSPFDPFGLPVCLRCTLSVERSQYYSIRHNNENETAHRAILYNILLDLLLDEGSPGE